MGIRTRPLSSLPHKEQQARSLLRGSRGSGECCTSFPPLVRDSKVTFTALGPSVSDYRDQRDIPRILPRSSVPGTTKTKR